MNKYAVLAFAFSLVFAACFGNHSSRNVSPHAPVGYLENPRKNKKPRNNEIESS